MGILLRKAIENKRNFLINKLINEGIYKKNDTHLFELTLTDLEEEYMKIKKNESLPSDEPCLNIH
ncbi:Fur-regulated basic protein FbpA [Peribacillus sp. NPDC097895]|uniref:Fur-regulated basic protein FbpA n=1 Tax=Peribacillus sp. NPDC097895 TaxID=3390619 RepID=UPI003CFE33C1